MTTTAGSARATRAYFPPLSMYPVGLPSLSRRSAFTPASAPRDMEILLTDPLDELTYTTLARKYRPPVQHTQLLTDVAERAALTVSHTG